MRKVLIVLIMAFVPSLLMAQAAGGTIKRPTKGINSSKKTQPSHKDVVSPQLNNRSITQDKISNGLKFNLYGIEFKMIRINGGSFTMGGTPEQGNDAYGEEFPAHDVTLSSFYLGETEVTQALWQAVMGSNPSAMKGDNLPVENVSWNDCKTFISKLNSMSGEDFRLPTEAEWEYAARGGEKSQRYKFSGSNTLNHVAWFSDNCGNESHLVKTKYPNELGLYDMSGNVQEWCQDWFDNYAANSQINPTGPASGIKRVFRGGSWFHYARTCRVSSRSFMEPNYRTNRLGFRLAL